MEVAGGSEEDPPGGACPFSTFTQRCGASSQYGVSTSPTTGWSFGVLIKKRGGWGAECLTTPRLHVSSLSQSTEQVSEVPAQI